MAVQTPINVHATQNLVQSLCLSSSLLKRESVQIKRLWNVHLSCSFQVLSSAPQICENVCNLPALSHLIKHDEHATTVLENCLYACAALAKGCGQQLQN